MFWNYRVKMNGGSTASNFCSAHLAPKIMKVKNKPVLTEVDVWACFSEAECFEHPAFFKEGLREQHRTNKNKTIQFFSVNS